MADDDLPTLVREFRTSVSDDLSATHRQMAELSDEVRARITTAETAILERGSGHGTRHRPSSGSD